MNKFIEELKSQGMKSMAVGAHKCIKQLLTDLKGEISSDVIRIENFIDPLSSTNKSIRKKWT